VVNTRDTPRFTEIAAGNLDIRVLGELPAAHLPFGDEFEPGSVKIVGFKTPLRRRRFVEQPLEYAPAHTDGAFVFPQTDTELDGIPDGIPTGIRGKAEEHCDLLAVKIPCSWIVLNRRVSRMTAAQRSAFRAGFILTTGIDGVRYAVRQHAVAVILDADECHNETLVQLHGGMSSGCPMSLDRYDCRDQPANNRCTASEGFFGFGK
jgi:hypothetical protein